MQNFNLVSAKMSLLKSSFARRFRQILLFGQRCPYLSKFIERLIIRVLSWPSNCKPRTWSSITAFTKARSWNLSEAVDLLHTAECSLELITAQLGKKFSVFYGIVRFVVCPQELSTGPCPDLFEFSPHLHTLVLFATQFSITAPTVLANLPRLLLSFGVSEKNFVKWKSPFLIR
jgi:hypothetical protein